MMNEDKLVEKLAKDLPKVIGEVVTGLLAFLLAPGAAATDPFFRKDLGERLFTLPLAILSIVVWTILWSASALIPWICPHILVHLTGLGIVGAYSFLAWNNLAAVHQRIANRVQWHSRSRGESIFGTEDWRHILLIEVVATIVLFLISPFFGGYFVFSRLQSYLRVWLSTAHYYNQYLDVIDGQIEAKYLQQALRDGLPPHMTEGLYRPLPRKLKGTLRADVARVAGGIQMPEGGVTSRQPAIVASAKPPSPAPLQTEPPPVAPDTPTAPVQPPKTPDLKINPKLIVGIIALLAVSLTAMAVVHFWPARPHRPATEAARPAYGQPAQPIVINPVTLATEPPPVTQNATQNATPEPPPVQTPPVVAPAPPPVDTAALALVALKKQREEEQQQAAQQRQNTIDQFYKTLSEKTAELAKLQTDTQVQLDANTNKIAKVSWLRRTSLRHQNEKNRLAILKALQTQQQSLNLVGDSIRLYTADPNSDPGQVTGNMQIYDQTEADIRGKIKAIMDAMDDDIAGNSGNSGLIQVR